jgi:hypothetical protein
MINSFNLRLFEKKRKENSPKIVEKFAGLKI